jgi:DNA replication protein DnaC
MEKIDKAIERLTKKIDFTVSRMFIDVSTEDFKKLFLALANRQIHKSNAFDEYCIDGSNKNVLNQLFYYTIGNAEKFNGDINKGIMLVGGFGTGKTTLIRVFGEMFSMFFNKNVTFISSQEVCEVVKGEEFALNFYEKRPIIIDEIGRENKSILVYGTERLPISELLVLRYNSKALTFGTSNLGLEDLSLYYGSYIGERLLEMFNFIELTGSSRRK